MPDVNQYLWWKVPDLKAELKKREIPVTGLRLKQQFIDKLMEDDERIEQNASTDLVSEESTAPVPEENASPPQPGPDPVLPAPDAQPEQPKDAPISQNGALQTDTDKIASVESQNLKDDTKAAEEAVSRGTTPVTNEPAVAASQPSANETSEDLRMKDSSKAQDTSTTSTLPAPGVNDLSTPVPTEEALEDTRKRKRRSQSPAPTPEEIAKRRALVEEMSPRVSLQDNKEDSHERPTDQPTEGHATSQKLNGKQDARFRDLFAPADVPPQPSSPSRDIAMPEADAGPALHPATSTIYIDGLMRPLQPIALRRHLSNLASAPDTASDPDAVVEFYLDTIKTHCFVSFTSTLAASRVRSAIHGTVWPNERDRKTLRADFIPDDKIKEWIQTEENSKGRSGPAPRWEVRYETSSDNEILATLSEVGLVPTGRRESGLNRTPPLGPRGDLERSNHRPSSPGPAIPQRPGQGFKPLDELFKSTTTKPKLYYLPVPRSVADKRLDQFDELIHKGVFPRHGGDEMRRITFEHEDQFVDAGPERLRQQGSRFGAGPRGRGRGGRRGDSWR